MAANTVHVIGKVGMMRFDARPAKLAPDDGSLLLAIGGSVVGREAGDNG